jgi:phosphoenolpyruvate synthase/pyruvate phosphate dikinase
MTEKWYADIPEEFWLKVVDLNRPQNNIKSFNWITWCKGKYTGNVKIISNIEKDKNKFKKWDILVTWMTRPEFVSLIKKAWWIITNEWWITCHAAIISRELWKPCVIWTKIATQILKDWDLVEVDADNWIVKILKDDNNVSNPWKSTEYIRMFQTLYLPFINAYILNSYYKKLWVISIYRNDTRTCYIPKDMTQETLKEWKTIYNDSKKYNTFTKDFETYKNSTISKYENIINNKNLIAEKIEDFLYSLPTFFKFYSKTEFFYTDSLFSTQQTEKERKKLLKIVEKVKNPWREFFNKLLFWEQSMLNQVLTKISLQTNIEKELLYLSTLEEIVWYVNNSKPDNEILKNREKGYVIKWNGESIELFYGNIASEYSKNFYNKSKNEKILKWRIANPGKAKWKVKIFKYNFKTFDSLNKIIESMDKWDILVAETTSPELILACQKAWAIITNQWWMMSHAAIISRELKIPCIVWVDNATDILKDWMMIEVNADIWEINIK